MNLRDLDSSIVFMVNKLVTRDEKLVFLRDEHASLMGKREILLQQQFQARVGSDEAVEGLVMRLEVLLPEFWSFVHGLRKLVSRRELEQGICLEFANLKVRGHQSPRAIQNISY